MGYLWYTFLGQFISVVNPLCVCVCAYLLVPVAWSLHRNLGFPLDLIGLMLEEQGLSVDQRALDVLAIENEKVTTASALPLLFST